MLYRWLTSQAEGAKRRRDKCGGRPIILIILYIKAKRTKRADSAHAREREIEDVIPPLCDGAAENHRVSRMDIAVIFRMTFLSPNTITNAEKKREIDQVLCISLRSETRLLLERNKREETNPSFLR